MTSRAPTGRRRIAAACVVVTTAALLAACSAGRPEARDTADELAAGLTAQQLTDLPTAAGGRVPQADLERIVKGMDGLKPTVTVDEVTEKDDTATATLTSTWTFDGSTWEYTTPATLTYVDEAWQVAWDSAIVAPDLGPDERLRVRTSAADRGDILGAGDEALVTERSVERIGIDKSRITPEQADGSARALAALIDVDADAYAKSVVAAGPQAFVVGIVVRTGSDDTLSAGELDAIPGAVQLAAEMSLAPTRTFGQPMLGVVGEATAEIVEKSKGSIQGGDLVGLSGLALRYDEQLRGAPGVTVEAVPADEAAEPRELFVGEAQAGTPLRTTIDVALQGSADEILADVDPASAIVAIRPSTGEILALSSGAGGEGADTAASSRQAPGSTFKLVTALALLRAGKDPSSPVPCTKTLTVDGRVFTNYSDYPSSAIGDIPLRSAIANSCNTAMIAERDEAPQAELTAAAAALGLGPDLDLGYPAFLGSVPDQADGTAHAASMIGQGQIEASPLAMAVVAASIANGTRVTPTLLVDTPTKPAAEAATPLTKDEATQLQELFRGVVTDGSGAFLDDVPGDPVSAKTGTAEYGTDTPPRTHAWMIASRGDLAVAVFVADGESGSQTAGPLLEEFLRSAP
ncbi:MAG: penicillin-binding transpeptidase domain-containing protein [Aeromicrobium sp.]